MAWAFSVTISSSVFKAGVGTFSLRVNAYRLTGMAGEIGHTSSPAVLAPMAVKGSTTARPSPASTMLRIIW
ncbi:hypothetical protein D3C80_2121710 [compost metagenome]